MVPRLPPGLLSAQGFHPALDGATKHRDFQLSPASSRPLPMTGEYAVSREHRSGREQAAQVPQLTPTCSVLALGPWLGLCEAWALLACEASGLLLGGHSVPKATRSASVPADRCPLVLHTLCLCTELVKGRCSVLTAGGKVRWVGGREEPSRGSPPMFPPAVPETAPICTLFIAEIWPGTPLQASRRPPR